MDFYRRLRHSYGYGVHSPLAYRLINDVLSPRGFVAWYGYEDIEQWLDRWRESPTASGSPIVYRSCRQLRKDARLLLRFAAFKRCSIVWMPKNTPEPLRVALRMADSRMKIVSDSGSLKYADFILALGENPGTDTLCRVMAKSGMRLLWLNPPEDTHPDDIFPGGVSLRGQHRIIAITGEPPLHQYSIL